MKLNSPSILLSLSCANQQARLLCIYKMLVTQTYIIHNKPARWDKCVIGCDNNAGKGATRDAREYECKVHERCFRILSCSGCLVLRAAGCAFVAEERQVLSENVSQVHSSSLIVDRSIRACVCACVRLSADRLLRCRVPAHLVMSALLCRVAYCGVDLMTSIAFNHSR